MIITRLLGGLGNQMFQYAAGLALAQARRTVLKLDVAWYREDKNFEDHNRYGLSCFNISEQFATQSEIERVKGVRLTRVERWSRTVARTLHFYRYARSHESHGSSFGQIGPVAYDPTLLEQPDDTYLDGMWQSPRYFDSVAGLVRLHFSIRYPMQPAVGKMLQQIRSGPSAALHFRRGDYIRNSDFNRDIGVVDMPYYHEAVKQILAREPKTTFYIFSDELASVQSEFISDAPHKFVNVVESWHPWDKIRLMSACDHLAIANSSFSWWAAWLNPSPEKLVVVPDPWFSRTSPSGCDIIPQGWLKLPAR